MYKLGIDLGGTKIEGIVIGPDGAHLFRERIQTEQSRGYEHILNSISSLYFTMVKKISGAPHTLGICTPGSVSKESGLLKNSNTVCLNGKPFQSDLENILSKKFDIQNDANCFALSEALFGAGKGKDLVFGIILGTGCGGGLVYQGRLLPGLMGISGEWGHSVIDPGGPACYCGKRGCVETFISGSGVERLYHEKTGITASMAEIMIQFERGDTEAIPVVQGFIYHFGLAVSNLINILDPDLIVIGGGISNIPLLYTDGIRSIEKFIFNDRFRTPVVKSLNGDSAGVIGAALVGI